MPHPPSADTVGSWHLDGYRDIFGVDRTVPDQNIRVYAFSSQGADGRMFDLAVHIARGEAAGGQILNSDQARELATALLDAVAEMGVW